MSREQQQSDFDTSGLYRTQAIINGHHKLLEGRMKDVVLQDAEAAGTHRFTPANSIVLAGEVITRSRVSLVPQAGDLGQTVLSRLDIWFPTMKRQEATQLVRQMHQNIIDIDEPGKYGDTSSSELNSVPTLNMFAKAQHITGQTIKFLVTPEAASTYDSLDEVKKAKIDLPRDDPRNIGLLYYVEQRSPLVTDNERKFREWFDIEQLGAVIKGFETTIDNDGLPRTA